MMMTTADAASINSSTAAEHHDVAPSSLSSYQTLHSVAGVLPSNEWLTACRSYLQSTTANSNDDTSPDNVLHQILHADLRNVVRSATSTSTDDHSKDASAVALRRAIAESQRDNTNTSNPSSCRQLLPPEFRLLLQMEEVLDVSLNAESRISLGPASQSAPTAIGNQAKRLLKLYLSDGHWPHVDIVAMEVSPILNLSPNSRAGMKLLVTGPDVEVRLGVLLLHEGNTTVLGGAVEWMVQLQRRALEQAQKLAGVGVDPTIKALIWNPDTGILDDENDEEGEGEAPISGPTNTGNHQGVQPQQHQQNTSIPSNTHHVQTRQQHQPLSLLAEARPTNTYTPHTMQSSNLPAEQLNSAAPTPCHSNNPYTHRVGSTANFINKTTTAAYTNPYATTTNKATPTTANKVTHTTAPPHVHSFAPSSNNHATTPSQALHNVVSPTTISTSSTGTTAAMVDLTQGPEEDEDVAMMSFHDLVQFLEKARTNRSLYEAHQNQVFIVHTQTKGVPKYFNIEKNKDGTGGEKYKYVMKAQISNDSTCITVSVSNSLLLSHFELGPTEMRKLSRTDKASADRKVQEGGCSAQQALVGMSLWEMKLLLTAEEFFKSKRALLDGDDAILVLLKKRIS